MKNVQDRQLKILIIDQNIAARSKLKNMLGTKGQSDVELMKDARDLVGKEQSFKYDLVFTRETSEYSPSGADLIRYLTRTNLVPKWCKFVLLTDDAEAIRSAPIFRHLRTEIWETPINYQMVESVVNATIQSLDVFQELLKNLNYIPASLLINKISNIDSKDFDATHKDELLELKIKLLLQGRRPDLAWNISEKIQDSSDKYREQMFIAFSLGSHVRYNDTMDAARSAGLMDRGCAYYKSYRAIMSGEYEMALRYYKEIDESDMHPNEMDAYALLLLKAEGLSKAIQFIEGKLDTKSENYDLRNTLTLCQVKCYSIALMTNDFGGIAKDDIIKAMHNSIANNTWAKGTFQYNIYKPFILLATALLQGKCVDASFEKLYGYRHQLDVSQLNVLLFAAQKQKMQKETWEIQKILDRCVARLEISPELISHEVTYRDILVTTMDKDERAKRYIDLALHHAKAGRLYRALKKFYQCEKMFGLDIEDKETMQDVMEALNVDQYWDIKLKDISAEIAAAEAPEELKEIA